MSAMNWQVLKGSFWMLYWEDTEKERVERGADYRSQIRKLLP